MSDKGGGPEDVAWREWDKHSSVLITTRDIYELAAATSGKVDALLAQAAAMRRDAEDHESRIRRLETRFFGVVGTLGLAAATAVALVLGRLLERTG